MTEMITLKSNSKRFIERANAVHGEKYGYSLVRYKGVNVDVKIICKKHGVFFQKPSQHLAGKGCPYCSANRLTRKEFLEHSANIYGDKFEFDKCTYTHKTGLNELITVTCKVHGDFIIKVDSFIIGKGCDKCAKEERQTSKPSLKKLSRKESTEENMCDNSLKSYRGIIRYKVPIVTEYACIWSPLFDTKPEAEKFIESMELCLGLADCLFIEAEIITHTQKYLNMEQAKKLLKWLNIESKEVYTIWWDSFQPAFLPRNLQEYYPNIEKVFTGSQAGVIVSILNTVKTIDEDERQRA